MNVGITYEIRDKSNPDLVYYGSSELSLEDRIKAHLDQFKYWKKNGKNYCYSFKVLELGNWKPTLLKIVFFTIKWELWEQERHLIEYQTCVNNNIPNRTKEEYREDNKEYIKKQKADYYEANKDKFKDYYQENKEKINEQFNCPCGGKYIHQNKARHTKSNKHQKWVLSQTPKNT